MTLPVENSGRHPAPRPAAPVPRRERPGLLAAFRAARTNPITLFPEEAYCKAVFEMGRGRKSVLLVSDPGEIERILIDDAGRYRKSRQQQGRLKPALGEGLLTAEDETWRGTRRIAAPHFNPKAIAAVAADMEECVAAMAQRWRERPDVPQPLDLAAEFQRLTYEVVSRTVFSGALDRDRALVHAHMAIYFDSVGRIDLPSIFNLPAWWPKPALRRAMPSIRVFRGVVEAAVGGRLQQATHRPADLLDRLLGSTDPATGRGLSPSAISDNVLTFLAAGHETTANALCWIFYLLALHPDVEAQVQEEIADVRRADGPASPSLNRLDFTKAVVNEALRLYPPAPFIGREAVGGDVIAGRTVREGSQILIAPWIVHRHRALWPDPDSFRPARFLVPDMIPRGAFLPFGLGPRVCIGQRFAMQEILITLAAILPQFRFELAAPERVLPLARITLAPAAGLPAYVTGR